MQIWLELEYTVKPFSSDISRRISSSWHKNYLGYVNRKKEGDDHVWDDDDGDFLMKWIGCHIIG